MNAIEKLIKEKNNIDAALWSLTIGTLDNIDPILWVTDEYSGYTDELLRNDMVSHQEIRDLTTKWEVNGQFIDFEWSRYSRAGYEYGGSYKIKMVFLLDDIVRNEYTAIAFQAKNHEEELARLDKELVEKIKKNAKLAKDRKTLEELLARKEKGEL